jgi:pyridinium-3,5-bisthiocarboxylic acid mononucleotide nickel chelatase
VRGVPIYSGPVRKELLTPTGAAIITTVADAYGPLPELVVDRIGYGAGARDVPNHPNVLRLLLGETAATRSGADRVAIVEAAIDDMTPEALGHFVDRALAEGALDVYLTPVHMKKNRPGVEVTLLAETVDLERMVRLMFRETTTIGLRHREAERRVLDRERVTVETPVGPIRVKVARLDGEVVNAAPEYEDCRSAAERTGVPLRQVQALAAAAYAGRTP